MQRLIKEYKSTTQLHYFQTLAVYLDITSICNHVEVPRQEYAYTGSKSLKLDLKAILWLPLYSVIVTSLQKSQIISEVTVGPTTQYIYHVKVRTTSWSAYF